MAAVATAVLGAGLVWGAAAGAAAASVVQVPAPTPTLIPGNPTTCEEAGIGGEILLESQTGGNATSAAGTGTVTDGTTLTVTINAGFTATGIVVKGGPNANLFTGPFVGPITIEGMQSPVNPGGNIPDISHWFVCGMASMTTTTPPTTTATTVTVTTTAAALPVTGPAPTGLIAAGVALVAGGGLTLFLLRRRRATAE